MGFCRGSVHIYFVVLPSRYTTRSARTQRSRVPWKNAVKIPLSHWLSDPAHFTLCVWFVDRMIRVGYIALSLVKSSIDWKTLAEAVET